MLFWGSNPSNETPPHLRALLQQEGDVHQQPTCRKAGCFTQGRHPAAPTSRRNCSQKPGTVARAADRLDRSCPSVENGAGGWQQAHRSPKTPSCPRGSPPKPRFPLPNTAGVYANEGWAAKAHLANSWSPPFGSHSLQDHQIIRQRQLFRSGN